MDLKARKKHQPSTKTQSTRTKSVPEKTEENSANYPCSLSIQCNTLLYTTLQNWLSSAHAAQDFTYTSVADIIRASLEAYRNGLELTELERPGSCKQTTVRVTQDQYNFYKKLPNQMRRKILERAVRTFMKNQ